MFTKDPGGPRGIGSGMAWSPSSRATLHAGTMARKLLASLNSRQHVDSCVASRPGSTRKARIALLGKGPIGSWGRQGLKSCCIRVRARVLGNAMFGERSPPRTSPIGCKPGFRCLGTTNCLVRPRNGAVSPQILSHHSCHAFKRLSAWATLWSVECGVRVPPNATVPSRSSRLHSLRHWTTFKW